MMSWGNNLTKIGTKVGYQLLEEVKEFCYLAITKNEICTKYDKESSQLKNVLLINRNHFSHEII